MFKFYEIASERLFTRRFVLEKDGAGIGGGELIYVPTGQESGRIEIRNFRLDEADPLTADLLAGALLNAACNTEVDVVRVDPGEQWARFGLRDCGEYLEARTRDVRFDAVCRSRDCASCKENCKGRDEA